MLFDTFCGEIMKLKDFQQKAVAATKRNFSNGIPSNLIVLPTGTGKTITATALIKSVNRKTLIIAHRRELIQQIYATIKAHWPEADVGTYDKKHPKVANKIVIGSVQFCTQAKRLKDLKRHGFGLLCIDEAHHATAPTYQNIIKHLGFQNNPRKLLIGLTATPERADLIPLSDTFSNVSYTRTINTMIDEGHLTPAVAHIINTSHSLKNVKIKKGDYIARSLANAINIPERNALIAQKFRVTI